MSPKCPTQRCRKVGKCSCYKGHYSRSSTPAAGAVASAIASAVACAVTERHTAEWAVNCFLILGRGDSV